MVIMDTIKLIIQILAAVSGSLAVLMSITVFIQFRWPAPILWFAKLFVSALSVWLVFTGVFVTIAGLATSSVFISIVGIYVALVFCMHIFKVTRPADFSSGFEKAFGLDWENQISNTQKNHFLL